MLKPLIAQAAQQLTRDLSDMSDKELTQLLTFTREMLRAVERPDSTEEQYADELASILAPYLADGEE